MSFAVKRVSSDILFNAQETMYPSMMAGLVHEAREFKTISSNYFGFVAEGTVTLERAGINPMTLVKGMYFSVPGSFRLDAKSGQAVIIERMGYRGLFSIGGPIEESGRLCYIDNCSTSQLVPPVRLGDPTIQLLVFPPNTDQSFHIHPTIRLGFIQSGSGFCKLADNKKIPLKAGDAFYLPERLIHGFISAAEPMVVIAYHPDSDVGPTDQSHPMLSRTYVQK